MKRWLTDFIPQKGGSAVRQDGSILLEIQNKPLSINEYSFMAEGGFCAAEYVVLEYAAFGLIRDHALHAPLLLGKNGEEEALLIELNDVTTDGKKHSVIVPVGAAAEYSALRLRFPVSAPKAWFRIDALYSCTADELPVRFDAYRTGAAEEGYETVALDGLYNDEMPVSPGVIDAGRGLPEGEVALSGIPFLFGKAPLNRIAPEPPPAENDDMIINFSVPARRSVCRPVSRDSGIEVPVGGMAREIVFAVAVTGKLHERWGFCAPDPTILGSAHGEVMMPLRAVDVERFQVEIVYENGLADTAFPYNIGLQRHVLTGETGLYAVPVGPWPVEKVVFRNRMLSADVSILAVTLNKDHAPLIPARQEACPQPVKLAAKDGVTREGSVLTFASGAVELRVNTQGGLRIVSLSNGCAPKFSAGGDLLRLRLPDGTVTGEFETEIIALDESRAVVSCKNAGLACTATISLAEDSTIAFALAVVNESDHEIRNGVIFPALDQAVFADWEDSWYMMPKYQNTLGNGHIYVYEESAPSFPMQFIDLFSPSQEGGLGLMTRELELKVRKYALTKDEGGVGMYVEYPDMYLKLAPGEAFEASPAEIFAHSGDWRCAFDRYRQWLKTWYAPYKSQNKEWYRRCFWLMAEITDFYETESFCRQPIWYDADKKQYNYDWIMDEQKELYGSYPDILHMWEWTYHPDVKHALWGNYGEEDYERIGGLENFTAALRATSERTGAAISLYVHPTLLSKYYSYSDQYMPELLVRREDGGLVGIYGDTFRMCHADERWRDRTLEMYQRIYRETKLPILYVDEFSLRIGNRCYSDQHGHPVPSNLLKTDREFISALRESLPEELVLYGEYAAVDVNARYIDCNITYHILDSIRDMIETAWTADDGDDTLGRVFIDLYRYAFPGIVQLVLPMAMRYLSWQPLKSTFFNGEAIYDSFWDAEESRGREFMGKAFRIKKEYGDCFASDTPDTMLSSPAYGVCVNRFPGKGRTLYTLYNSAYETKRGALIEADYEEGVTYWDVWNDCACETELAGDKVYVRGCIGAQEVGCIVTRREA